MSTSPTKKKHDRRVFGASIFTIYSIQGLGEVSDKSSTSLSKHTLRIPWSIWWLKKQLCASPRSQWVWKKHTNLIHHHIARDNEKIQEIPVSTTKTPLTVGTCEICKHGMYLNYVSVIKKNTQRAPTPHTHTHTYVHKSSGFYMTYACTLVMSS